MIEQVRQAKEIKRRELDKVRAVNDDLQPKREQAEKRTEAPFDLVTVTIVTKKNNIPTGGYEVWFVKVLHEDDESKYDTFNKYSDDKCGNSDDKCGKTSKDLPPSNYKMWTKTTDGRKVLGDREKKVVGDGSPTVEFDPTAKD